MQQSQEESFAETRASFDAIVSEYEGALLRYVARIVHDPCTAQDVVQDSFIRLFRTWKDELKPSPPVLSWLYRVAHNIAVDQLRGQNRRSLLHLRQAREQEDPPAAAGTSAERPLSPEAERAADVLGSLSRREQQLVILKIYEEKSYREISEITGLSMGNVGYILHNAMKKMGERLKKAKAP